MNDGGLSWLRKSYQRMKEQAEREDRDLADLVVQRYGVRTDATLQLSHVPGLIVPMQHHVMRILSDVWYACLFRHRYNAQMLLGHFYVYFQKRIKQNLKVLKYLLYFPSPLTVGGTV